MKHTMSQHLTTIASDDLLTLENPMKRQRKPVWLKAKAPGSPGFLELKRLVGELELNTVCESAMCPNIGECWDRGTATFMILGDICTRRCGFCAIATGKPEGLDLDEPKRVGQAIQRLGLRHAVVTSVNRDELEDGGAFIFAETILKIREFSPETSIEVLVPDFQGDWDALKIVMDAGPDILNHNLETIPRLYRLMRPQAVYERSLELLRRAKQFAGGTPTKSGIMIGAGESWDEVIQTMADISETGCDILTIGQYLQPSPAHVPVLHYYLPEAFDRLKALGREMGFRHVESGPLVRSSYHAEEQVVIAENRIGLERQA